MTQFDGEEFGQARIDQLASIIERLENQDVYTGHAKRFLAVGEWGLAFREVYFAAVADGKAYRSLEVEFESLNSFLAKYKYYATHLGFPLA